MWEHSIPQLWVFFNVPAAWTKPGDTVRTHVLSSTQTRKTAEHVVVGFFKINAALLQDNLAGAAP